jgi:hypothetical protein
MRPTIYVRIAMLVVAGLIFLVIGFLQVADPATKCGGKTQSSNQVCVSSTGQRSISDQKKENQQQGWISILGGGIMLVGAIGLAVKGHRTARPQAPVWARGTQPGCGPGYVPHNYYQQNSNQMHWATTASPAPAGPPAGRAGLNPPRYPAPQRPTFR